MRILYGVVGEGMGHATRSRGVLRHLVDAGHEVEIMTSGRARDFLAEHFRDVNEIHGLHFVTEDNRIRKGKTLWSNVLSGSIGVPRNIAAYFDLIESFDPQVVISDFESWTYFYAKAHRLPTFSIDNMQVINRCRHPPEILEGQQASFEVARAFVKSKLPFCDHYLITTFFRPRSARNARPCTRRSCARRSSPLGRFAATTCSSIKPPRATKTSSERCRPRAWSAALTGWCAASKRSASRATSAIVRSRSRASSTTSPARAP